MPRTRFRSHNCQLSLCPLEILIELIKITIETGVNVYSTNVDTESRIDAIGKVINEI